MQFFTAPWEVVEGDVAGCGPRLFLTGTKLLIAAWEKLVSDARLASLDASELDGISWVALQHGLRAIAPISIREQLAVLVSTDELADSSTLRLYYRVTRVTGEPVACAFVVIACSAKATGNMTTLPAVVREYLASHGDFRERTGSPSFIERALLLPNAEESLFPEDVRTLGARVATQVRPAAVHRRTPVARLSIPALGELPVPEGRTAFFFPDAPSYDGRLLCELRAYLPYLADYFDQAEEVSRRVFRQSFLPLVDMDAIALHDQRLERCPELAHVGVMLTGVLIAESLREHDIRADALIGDGLGELTALAIAGATDLSTALKLAALRAIATRSTNGSGESTSSEQFAAALADVRFESPRLPVVSLRNRPPFNRIADDRGGSLGAATADDDLVATAWGAGCEFVIECGPRGFLTTSVRAPGSVLRFTPTVQAEASLG